MPSLYYKVEAPGVNILDDVTQQVVNGLLAELNLTQSFDQSVYIMSSFYASSDFGDGQGEPTLIENRCDVNVNYIMDKSQVPWPVESPYTTQAYGVRSSHKGYHTPLLIDQDANILIEHYTVACALKMDFKFTFNTFDEATKAFDTIQSRHKGTLVQTPYDLAFSYPVNNDLYAFLIAVQKAKLAYANKSVLDYIKDMKQTEISFDVRKSQLTDPNADVALMIRCQELRCIAQLTMDQTEPDPIMVNSLPSGYTLSFTMNVQFGRPTTIAVHSPVSVDNTLLPPSMFATSLQTYHFNPSAQGIMQDCVFNGFIKSVYGSYQNAQAITRMPAYDDWYSCDNQYCFFEYRPFFIAHFTLDGPVTTIDLKQLNDFALHPIVQSIMKEAGNGVFNYGGVFHIGVFANTLRLGTHLVSIDENLILTITSNRMDKVYHLVLSETTALNKMDGSADATLIKYRYFFPLTITRNIQTLVNKRYYKVTADDNFLNMLYYLDISGKLNPLLRTMVSLGEVTNEIYGYTQTMTQLAEYLTYTQSLRDDYALPVGTDSISVLIQTYYTTKVSITSRSLFVAFVEQCLISGHLTLDTVPAEYLEYNTGAFPYLNRQGNNYGFNTPLRVFNITVIPQRDS